MSNFFQMKSNKVPSYADDGSSRASKNQQKFAAYGGRPQPQMSGQVRAMNGQQNPAQFMGNFHQVQRISGQGNRVPASRIAQKKSTSVAKHGSQAQFRAMQQQKFASGVQIGRASCRERVC